jgi:hypothetical protein
MDEYFEYFLSKMGPQLQKIQPTKMQINKFSGKLPTQLLDYWAEYGWGGFHNGLFWITDPEEYTSVVESWLEGTNIPDQKNYHVISRSAFGRIFLWNKKTGQNITIDSLCSQIISSPADKYVASGNDTRSLQAFFSSTRPDELDLEDYKDKPLFNRALTALGPISADEMYGFEPALCIGGAPILANLKKVKIISHLLLLNQLGEVDIMYLDVTRHL